MIFIIIIIIIIVFVVVDNSVFSECWVEGEVDADTGHHNGGGISQRQSVGYWSVS